MRDFRIIDIDDRLVETVSGRWTTGRGGRCRSNGLRIQMNHDPPQIVVINHIVGPDDGSNHFLPATYAGHYALTHVGIIAFRAIVRIVQSSNRQADDDRQSDAAITNGFLQNHETPGMLLFVRHDTAKRHFPAEGIQCILRIENRFINPKDFKLLQIHAAGITDANQRR
jgi:hypothetical protein